MKVPKTLRPAVALLLLSLPAAGWAKACLLSAEELGTIVGRGFNAGQESKAVDGSGLCTYAEVDSPKRRLLINVVDANARKRFEANKRLLTMSRKSIDFAGAGDAAFYNGTTAAVLSGEKMIVFSNVKPPPGSKPSHLSDEQILKLLNAALERLPK